MVALVAALVLRSQKQRASTPALWAWGAGGYLMMAGTVVFLIVLAEAFLRRRRIVV